MHHEYYHVYSRYNYVYNPQFIKMYWKIKNFNYWFDFVIFAERGTPELAGPNQGVCSQLPKPVAFLQTKTQEDTRWAEESLGEVQ